MQPRRGTVVAEVTPHRLVEMFEVMGELEALCGRLSARRMSALDHQRLLEAHRACERAAQASDPDTYYYQNELFHQQIYDGSHNGFLVEQATALHRRLRPYRRLQLRVRDRLPTSFHEHVPGLTNPMLFARDRHVCAYCGGRFQSRDLSRDHVRPVSRGGRDSWTNSVTACRGCNTRKGNRSPEQADMPLLYVPYVPNRHEHFILRNRRILVDQMEYLLAGVPRTSRLHLSGHA